MTDSNKISCIIASYNEAPRIGSVLDVVYHHPLIDEVVVVDDGSADDTQEVLKKYPDLKIILQKPNKGKTHAVMRGIESSRNNLIMLIDADLFGLNASAISSLASPVLSGLADVSISIRSNSLSIYKMLGIDYVSGERVFHKIMLGDVRNFMNLPRFGLETYMNDIIVREKLRIKIVPWDTVGHYRKSEKMGALQGTLKEMAMLIQISKTIKITALLKQFYKIRLLRV